MIWGSIDFMELNEKDIIFKNITNIRGENIFLLWINLINIFNFQEFKYYIEYIKNDIKDLFKTETLKINDIQIIYREKYLKEYDFPLELNGIILRILYSKIKNK